MLDFIFYYFAGVQAIVNAPPVYFYVQRATNFVDKNVIIPFEVEILNIGKAMDLKSGIFTAPRAGMYFFSFSGYSAGSVFSLFSNGNLIGSAASLYTGSLQSTLQLKAGEKVTLQCTNGAGLIFDPNLPYQFHFTGFFLHD